MTTVSDDFSGDLSNWSQDTGTWAIASGALTCTSTGGDHWKIRYLTALASADHWVEADITTYLNFNRALGVGARLAAGTGDGNSDGYSYDFYGGDFAYLSRFADSVETILDTGAAVTASTLYTNCRLTCNGTALSANRNGGADDANATDATYSTTSVGAWAFADGGNLKNWEAQDIAAGAVVGRGLLEGLKMSRVGLVN